MVRHHLVTTPTAVGLCYRSLLAKQRKRVISASNPRFRSRIAHRIDFPDYTADELLEIGRLMLAQQDYRFSDGARAALRDGVGERMRQPHVANACSIRNALDRTRLRQATSGGRPLTADDLMTIEAAAVRASRVLAGGRETSLADREQPS